MRHPWIVLLVVTLTACGGGAAGEQMVRTGPTQPPSTVVSGPSLGDTLDAHILLHWGRVQQYAEGVTYRRTLAFAAEVEAAKQAAAARAERDRRERVSRPRHSRGVPASGLGTGACGGNLPPCSVLMCESGGNPHAENPHSSASGLWQIIDQTWQSIPGTEGYSHASDAPVSVQNAAAAHLWNGGAGASQWVCR